jgi:phage protein D
MAQVASLPIRASRPSIEIDGQRNATLTDSLMSMHISESEEGMSRCELVLGNWGGANGPGFQYFARDTLEYGKNIKISVGDGSLFDGRISAISGKFPDGGPPQAGVCAEDRLQDLRMTRRTRTFSDASLSDVLNRIAGDHGLQTQADLQGPTHKLLAQVNQSDLAFVRDLARREDAQIWVEGTQLKAAQRSRRNTATVELAWAGSLREFDVCADLANQRTKLVGTGWDVSGKRAAKHDADDVSIQSELNGEASGSQTLQQAFGARVDTLAHDLPSDDAQARTLAEASFRYMARRFVVGRGVAETQSSMRVGSKLSIRGVGPLFEGDYTATEVHVRFDSIKGLRTEFCCDRPSIGRV